MADDVLANKAAMIERCVRRAREEYERAPETFTVDHTRQDAAISTSSVHAKPRWTWAST
ncbi:MAG: hypothetical protein QM601_12525 [Pseudoxanthomonas sp.]